MVDLFWSAQNERVEDCGVVPRPREGSGLYLYRPLSTKLLSDVSISPRGRITFDCPGEAAPRDEGGMSTGN